MNFSPKLQNWLLAKWEPELKALDPNVGNLIRAKDAQWEWFSDHDPKEAKSLSPLYCFKELLPFKWERKANLNLGFE